MSKKLQAAALEQAAQKRNVFQVRVEEGVQVEDMVVPQFWSHVAKRFTMFDRIEAVSKSGEFWAEFVVLRRTDTAAKVKLVNFVDLTQEDYSDLNNVLASEYFVQFLGESEWCVVQRGLKGNTVVLKNLPTEKEAEKARVNHLRALAA